MAVPRIDTKSTPGKSKDEKSLLNELRDLVSESKRSKKSAITESFEDNRACYRGELTKNDEPDSEEEEFYANIVASYLDIQVSRLTATRPIVRVATSKKGLHAVASVLGRMLPIVWDKSRTQQKITRLLNTSGVYSSAGLYTGWDLTNNRVGFEIIQPQALFPDTSWKEAEALDMARSVIIKRTSTLEEIELRFPGRGKFVEADDDITVGERQLVTSETKSASLEDEINAEGDGKGKPNDGIPRAVIFESFRRDTQKLASDKMAFPTGRRTVFTKDIVLLDHPNPYWDGVHPIDWHEWMPDIDSPWGLSAVKPIRSIQLGVNDIMGEHIANIIKANYTTVEADSDILSPEDANRLRDLERYQLFEFQKRTGRFSIQPPAAFPADKINVTDKLLDFANMIQGVPPSWFGESPGALQSGKGLEGLKEGGSYTGNAKSARLEDLLTRVGQKVISRIIQFYSAADIIDILGEDDDTKAYAELRQTLRVDDDGMVMDNEKRKAIFHNIRFIVTPGSSESGARQRRFQNGAVIFGQGLLAGDELLELADFPDAEGTIERAKKWHAANRPPAPPDGKGEGGSPVAQSDSRFPS